MANSVKTVNDKKKKEAEFEEHFIQVYERFLKRNRLTRYSIKKERFIEIYKDFLRSVYCEASKLSNNDK